MTTENRAPRWHVPAFTVCLAVELAGGTLMARTGQWPFAVLMYGGAVFTMTALAWPRLRVAVQVRQARRQLGRFDAGRAGDEPARRVAAMVGPGRRR
jgi:hypothetical protein